MNNLILEKINLDLESSQHTMGDSLLRYVDIKTHQLIKENTDKPTIVVGNYSRKNNTISIYEKRDKLFNWKRPTAEVKQNSIFINCFPGKDYVFHYANIIATYYYLFGRDIDVYYSLPSEEECYKELSQSNLKEIPTTEIVILGYVEQLSSLVSNQEWKGEGDFLYKKGIINSKSVSFLGCKHSYWADISSRVVSFLAEKGVKLVIYVGKLGSLDVNHLPNETLATGNFSLLNNESITWNNIFDNVLNSRVKFGKHYNLPSIIQETIEWRDSVKQKFSFVDPEIGYMAKAANENNIGFSYLHICSDNLSVKLSEDLSNERAISVISKRASLLNLTNKILLDTL